MPHYKRNGDGSRIEKKPAGEGGSRPGCFYARSILITQKPPEILPEYLKHYRNGVPTPAEAARLDGLRKPGAAVAGAAGGGESSS